MRDLELAVADELDGTRMAAVQVLLDRRPGRGGDPALSEHKRMELAHARSAADPSGSDLAVPGDRFVAILATATPGGDLVGYAHLSIGPGPGQFAVESVVAPEVDGPDAVADALLGATVDRVRSSGGGTLRLWVPQATEADDRRARSHGFGVERNLIQMRCPLPVPPGPGQPSSQPLPVRPFRIGSDEPAWLITNNRAFATHPEQGHWELATLLEREQEPWFDPDGFLVLEVDGRVAGSCWTKIHARADPPMGEIYVISVDPDFHGRGWGRALTRAGLDWLAGQGLAVGMLYVDADNVAATTMYRSMGFVEDHVDRAYLVTVEPG
jgi:mycothiol synthase